MGLFRLTEAISAGLERCVAALSAPVETGVPLLKRLPTDAPVASLRLPCNRSTYLLIDEFISTIHINGEIVQVVDETPTGDHITEESLRPFIEFVMQQIQMWTIIGSRDADIARIRSWFQDLQGYLTTLESNAADDGDITVLARSRAISKQVKKREGSIIDRLLQLENKEAVSKLNSQKKADWLNSVKDDKGGRALAKRAHKAQGGEIDYSEQAQTAVSTIAASKISEVPPNDTVSFYSLANARESTVVAARELVAVVDGLVATDVLPCIGLNGVPFEANPGNYVDPFSLRIRQGNLFLGQILGEEDVWVRRIQGKSTNFPCPGRPNSNITGVIALRDVDPAAYDLMTSPNVRPYFEMQCSVQLRGALAVVPHDAVALNMAAVWNILETFGKNGSLTTLEKSSLDSFVGNVRYLASRSKIYSEIYTSLQNADVRPWLSGDREISNILKVVTALICFYQDQPNINLSGVLRALYYFEAYQSAKRLFRDSDTPEARANLLRLTLGIDTVHHATPLLPLFEAEPDNPAHYSIVDVESLVIPPSIPSTRPFVALWSYLNRQEETNYDNKATVALGLPSRILRASAAVQSLECANESDRINTATRVALVPDPTTTDAALLYISGVVRRHYEEDYQRRLKEKRRQESQIVLNRQINELVDADNYATFRKLLLSSVIENRDHPGFTTLMDIMCDGQRQIIDRLPKLSLLMTGRDMDTPSVPVWANGNFLLNWDRIIPLFENSDGGRALLVELRAARKKYGVHTYRDSGPNRHKHGNNFLSYWALGYKDLYHMRAQVSNAEFQEYITKHCKQNGCCIPNDQKSDFGL